MSFPLRILTPEGPVFNASVDLLNVTAYNGSMGVLTGHAPLLAAVVVGPGKVVVEGKESWYVFGEGTLEVRSPDVVLLVDFAEACPTYEAAKDLTAKGRS
jgi:F-type H+-transporting ATPase subunit epsilon